MSSKRKLSFLKTALAIGLFAVTLPISLPISLLMLAYQVRQEHRLKRELAESTACFKCCKLLGVESLKLADQEVAREQAERKQKYPGMRFRLVRTLHALCRNCGARHTYFKRQKKFELENLSATLKERKRVNK